MRGSAQNAGMAVPKSYKQVLKHHSAQPGEIQKYFEHIPKLIDAEMPYDIALAYLFSRIERIRLANPG